MRKHLFAVAAALLSFISGAAGISTPSVMRVEPIGYRVGTAGAIADFASSVVTVSPGGVSTVATNRQMTFTAALNGDYKIVCWQKFAVDPRVRENDSLEEFGTDSKTVTVDYDPNVDWMYVVVVVDYDLKVTADISSFGRGTVTVSPKKDSYAKGESVTLDVELDEGYRFVRWSDGNADHLRNLVLDTSVNLKACVEPKSSIVTFSPGDGATVGVTEKRVSYGSPYGALPVPTKTGSVFSGWKDDEQRMITAKTAVSQDADHVLYASWEDELFKIAGDFTGRGNGKVDGAGVYAYGSQPTLKAVPYEGSAFIGWADGVTLNPRRITVVSNATYVARFDVATYDVTFTYRDASGNFVTIGPTTVEHGGKVDPPSKDVVDSWSEHTFTNWSTEEYKKVTRNLAVTAIYDTMTYSVAFAYRDWQGNCVTTMPQHVTAGGSANPPDRSVADNWAGHTLRGWQPDYNVIRQDTICEALYEINTYTVTFSYRGPDGELREASEPVQHGGMVKAVPEASVVDNWSGHRFLGWSNEDYRNPIIGNLKVIARYEGYCTIVYQDAIGTNYWDEVKDPKDWINLRPVAELNEIDGYAFEKTGHEFAGWGTNETGNAIYGDGAKVRVQNGEALLLISKWDPIQYTIRFDQNGGDGKVPDEPMTYDDEDFAKEIEVDCFGGLDKPHTTRAGHELIGWSRKRNPSATDEVFAIATNKSGSIIVTITNNLATVDGEVVTLYAIWQGKPQIVTINGKPTQIAYGSELQQPPDPVRTGYTFSGGWKTNGIPVTFPITVTGGFDLISDDKWTPIQYTVVFDGTDADGGTMEPQEFAYDVAQALTPNGFTRTGYTFANWTNEIGTIFADGAQVKNLATNDGEVVDLYATWTMNPHYYAVAFDGNGADGGSMATNRFECGKGGKLPANGFTRTGYAFNQWTNETATGMSPPLLDDGATFTEDLAPTNGTATLSALWAPNRYWVKFDGNGGAGSMAAQEFTYDVAQALTSNKFTKTGHAFAGWATNATGAAVYTDEQRVKNLTADPDATNTLFAAWTVLSYEISFDSAGGSAVAPVTNEFGKAVSAPTPTKKGHQFDGWYEGDDLFDFSSMPARNVALTAHWAPNAYTVRFNSGEGTGNAYTQGFTYDAPQALEANRFTAPEMMVFDCWTNAVDSTTYADCETVCNLATGGVFVLYATWKDAPSYAVAFDGNGADGGSMATNRFECGKGGTLASNKFSRTGYAFNQWTNETATGMSPPLLDDGATFTKDLAPTNGTATLKALWAPNRFWVKFEPNGGAGPMAAQAFTYDVAQALTSNAFTKTGHAFDGWKTNETDAAVFADGAVVSNLTAAADATNTLWAAWTANSYKVHYNPNGGSGSVVTQDFTYAQAQPLAQNPFEPPQPRMVFAGWSNATDKVVYNAGASVSNLTAEPDGQVDFYAIWADDSYTVTFDGNGGVGGMTPQVFAHGEKRSLAPNVFTRIGHSFKNWTNDDSSKSYMDQEEFTAPSTGDGETLRAVWTNNTYKYTLKYTSGDVSKSKKYGETITDPQPDSKTGYTFVGWTTNETDIVNFTGFTMPAHDVVFTSMWNPITYTVEFDANGGTGSADKINATYDQSFRLASSSGFSWSGYEFVSWTNANGQAWESDAIVSNLTTIANTNVTLYAKWQETGNPLSIALGAVPSDWNTISSPDNCWTPIGRAGEGVQQNQLSPEGYLEIPFSEAGNLTFTFIKSGGAEYEPALTFNGNDVEFERSLVDEHELTIPKPGNLKLKGAPDKGAWTLQFTSWTPSSAK